MSQLRASMMLLTALSVAHAQAWETSLSECDSPGHARVLHEPRPGTPRDARAIWLDASRLHWPEAPADGRYRLHHSASGQITISDHGVLDGADASLDLERVSQPAPAKPGDRFAHVRAGTSLVLRRADRARAGTLLRGQLILAREDATGRVIEATHTQSAGALDDLYAAAAQKESLGTHIQRGRTALRLWAPTARNVSVCVHEGASDHARMLLPMQREGHSGIWHLRPRDDLAGRYITYLVDVHVPGSGLVRNRVTDPYATSLSADSLRTWIGDLDSPQLKPDGWDRATRPPGLAAPTDMAIYELHVRDFSIGDASVPAAHRGKYLAFTDDQSDGMRHLRALREAGITDIHLLPVFDFATVPETGCVTPVLAGAADDETTQAAIEAVKQRDCFNWGYDPLHYSAPEGSYATDARDGAIRIREFRRMVLALHAVGLRVGMDVVYNHTSASGQDPRSVLDRIVPGYYHRLDANGVVEQSTCCANTATEHRMMERLMIDSVVRWVRDYRIDSLRFDLMGHQPRAAMLRLQAAVDAAAGRHVELLGEGWNFGEVADGARFVQASQLALGGSGIATFSDRARDAVRGGSAGDDGVDQVRNQGWLNGMHHAPNTLSEGLHSRAELMRSADLVRVGLAGSLRDYPMLTWQDVRVPLAQIDYAGQPAGYVAEPGEVVNYVENHDNQTLFDSNAFKLAQDTSPEDRARVQVLGAAIVAFSQGIAYFHAGQELLRSKSMDRNSYDSGDWFNRLDWTLQDNGFAAGLPPAQDNRASWEWMRPRLADARIKPEPEQIAWTRSAFLDLLRLRASSTLFRLRTSAEVIARLRLPNTGSTQEPTVLAGHLDGRGLAGAEFAEILYFIHAGTRTQTLVLDAQIGKPWVLHPLHRTTGAADRRPADFAAFDAARGAFTLPPRTALVFVIEDRPE